MNIAPHLKIQKLLYFLSQLHFLCSSQYYDIITCIFCAYTNTIISHHSSVGLSADGARNINCLRIGFQKLVSGSTNCFSTIRTIRFLHGPATFSNDILFGLVKKKKGCSWSEYVID